MARIRTIKPELPQSESMGNVSRDARLLFIMTWTLADDEGRLRGNSRMLASLLFPYDNDAPKLIDGWLEQLERECCIIRYKDDGQTYIQICNWLIHQKIDKPSRSKIPPFDGDSRNLANTREDSSEDQGPRTKDQGRDQGKEGTKTGTNLVDLKADPPPKDDPVAAIFAYWQRTMSSPRSALDKPRRTAIEKALKNYTPRQVCEAIKGCSLTAHNMGDNKDNQKYNSITLILRDADHIDRFIAKAQSNPNGKPVGEPQSEAEKLAEIQRELEKLNGNVPNFAHDDGNTIDMEMPNAQQ